MIVGHARLVDLAEQWGVDREYVDGQGRLHRVDPEILRRILESVSGGRRAPQRRLSPTPVAPERAYSPGWFTEGRRVWALGVQLYSVRSRRNWGCGDFTDLIALSELAASLGAAGVGLNPLHALFIDEPEQASPYSPNSRLFLNPLYIDVEAVPEFPGVRAAGRESDIARLRRTSMVDYSGVAAAKLAALRLAFANFRRNGSRERVDDFRTFRREQGRPLELFASFETLRASFGRVWPDWPAEWRHPNAGALRQMRRARREEFEFHEFTQWLADRQLRACRDKARALGLPLGLYLDVAVGVDPHGADAWSDQSAILTGATIGAPPDRLNTAGQRWALAAYNPRLLERQAFAPLRRTLAAAMRYAGAVRLDHVLGLNRLYVIPDGARSGTYVRYPLDAMLAVVAQESVSHECLVIGEDLGTVPENFRATVADRGIWSYRVMLFERASDGSFAPPARYPRSALVTFSTHDLPTFAGWCAGRDLQQKRALGMDPGETDEERAAALGALRAALAQRAGGKRHALSFPAVANYLAAAPSGILMISLEDALGVLEQPNLPGTTGEHPNWRRRLPATLEDLASDERLLALANVLRTAGRGISAERRDPRG
jgi:4-alpha-glucanotransferase